MSVDLVNRTDSKLFTRIASTYVISNEVQFVLSTSSYIYSNLLNCGLKWIDMNTSEALPTVLLTLQFRILCATVYIYIYIYIYIY